MQPATRGDGVRLQLSGSDIVSLRAAGTLAGVVVLAVGALNGTGYGRLISSISPGGGPQLAWQAPGSATAGVPQQVYTDGDYLLEDGDDNTKFIRVRVYGTYLPQAGEARVYTADRFNELGPADITAAQAAAGQVTTTTYALENASACTVYNVKAWLPKLFYSDGITISSDGVNFYDPVGETDLNVLTWASIAPGATVPLYVKQTIAAGALSDPGKLNILFFAWDGI